MILKLLAGAVGLVGMLGAASAADIPARPYYKAPPPPVFNWTGFYVGAHIGYGDGDLQVIGDIGIDGIFGGIQIGYNWQALGSPWVFGIEADISASDIGASFAGGLAETKIDFLGTVRGRVGYAWDRVMIYATGGFAYARNELSALLTSDATHTGYTVGAGLEWAFGHRWSAKIEYLYFDLSDENYATAVVPVGLEFHTIKLGVNYRF